MTRRSHEVKDNDDGGGNIVEERETVIASSEKAKEEIEEEEVSGDYVLAPEGVKECDNDQSGQSDGTIHSGLQEATVTQLEESVMDLSDHGAQLLQAVTAGEEGDDDLHIRDSSSSPNKMVEVAMLDVDDDDDDNNEVYVADLPLPDMASMAIVAGEEDAVQSLSPMLSGVEVEESEDDSDDNDTLTSKTSHHDYQSLATTFEDTVGEREEENDEDEEEDRRTLRGSVDDNDNDSLRKNSYPSPPVGGPNEADILFSSQIDTGAGGDAMSGSSSVDPEKTHKDFDSDYTEPTEI